MRHLSLSRFNNASLWQLVVFVLSLHRVARGSRPLAIAACYLQLSVGAQAAVVADGYSRHGLPLQLQAEVGHRHTAGAIHQELDSGPDLPDRSSRSSPRVLARRVPPPASATTTAGTSAAGIPAVDAATDASLPSPYMAHADACPEGTSRFGIYCMQSELAYAPQAGYYLLCRPIGACRGQHKFCAKTTRPSFVCPSGTVCRRLASQAVARAAAGNKQRGGWYGHVTGEPEPLIECVPPAQLDHAAMHAAAESRRQRERARRSAKAAAARPSPYSDFTGRRGGRLPRTPALAAGSVAVVVAAEMGDQSPAVHMRVAEAEADSLTSKTTAAATAEIDLSVVVLERQTGHQSAPTEERTWEFGFVPGSSSTGAAAVLGVSVDVEPGGS